MWDWPIWAGLMLGVLVGIAALALLVARALKAWRELQDTRTDVLRRVDDFARKAEAVAEKVAAARDSAELQGSHERLRVSLAQLAVLRAALDEAHGTFGRVTAVVPRK